MKRSFNLIDSLIMAPIYAFFMVISCAVVMFAEMLILRVLDLTVVMNATTVGLVRAIIYTVGVCAVLAIASYREGYHAAGYSIPETLLSGILGAVIHFLFALLFNFEAFCAGAVKFVSALLKYGSYLNVKDAVVELFRYDCIIVFVIYGVIYALLITFFKRLGAMKRIVDRKELTSSEKTPSERDFEKNSETEAEGGTEE
jgi:hypothetical protein